MPYRRLFFVGRAERITIALMLMLGLGALLLHSFVVAPGATTDMDPIDSLITSPIYVGPPASMRSGQIKKFASRRSLDLNTIDSLTLIQVPGIGPAFAHRILDLRKRLGGYYTVLQLQEVWGMDEDKYLALRRWFVIGTPPRRTPISSLRADEVPQHPYLSAKQRREINRLLYRHDSITSWHTLMKSALFSRDDSIRLSPYFPEKR